MGDSWSSLPQELIVEVNNIMEKLKTYDEATYQHCVRVSYLCRFLAEEAKLSAYDCLVAQFAGLLHDVGKMKTPLKILNKPAQLDDKEYKVMKEHPIKSAEMIEHLTIHPFFCDVQVAVLHHHERVDGKGYPDQLQGEELPYIARLILIVDTVDAMTQDRAYRKGLPMDVVYQELGKHSGTQFDKALVDVFIKAHKAEKLQISKAKVIKMPFLVNAA